MVGCPALLLRIAPLVLHVVALIHYLIAEYYYQHYLKLPNYGPYLIFSTYGGRFNFLTMWNMGYQGVFFLVCLVNDIIGSNQMNPIRPPLVRRVRDFLHAAVGFPLSLFVGTGFWSLWLYDRELVFPKIWDNYFPVWLNHTMHSTIVMYTLLHGFMCYTHYPKRSTGLSTLLSLLTLYAAWVLAVHFGAGLWTYQIFEKLNWPQRILFLGGSTTVVVACYLIGEFYNAAIWSSKERYIISKNQ